MKISGKAIAAIVVVAALAVGALIAQKTSTGSSSTSYNLSKQDMELLVSEVLPPSQAAQLNTNPESKQNLVKRLKELLALAQAAENKGLAEKPEVQEQFKLQSDFALREAYEKKHPEVKITDDDINNYYASNPKAFDNFLEANPQFKAQAQGPQAEGIKKEFGTLKILADKARQEKLDQDGATKIKVLIGRSEALARAYVTDLQQSKDLVPEEEIQRYYNDNPAEFEEVRARHILVSTSPEEAPADEKSKDAKPKALSKEEAKKKAQALLDRIRKGEDIAKLAGENSDDPGSKTQGGDLGYFTKGKMVEEFSNTAFSLKPGEISDLVETQFGYHIIKVEDHRTKPLDEDTKKEITDKLKQKKVEEHIKQLAENSKIQVAEDFEVKVTAPPAPTMSLPPTPPVNEEGEGAKKEAPAKETKPAASKDKKK
ncbi:MAG: peptidylprolyl isomerase [Acidobacteriota bacterium]